MVRLKSRTVVPPGGYHFFQPQTGRHFIGWEFWTVAREIQAHRAGNPRFSLAADLETIGDELDEANARRVLNIPNAQGYLETHESPEPPKTRAPRQAANARLVAGGVVALAEWSIAGEVVPQALAEQRAAVCARRGDGKPCPKNKSGEWTDWFTEAGAALVKGQLALRNQRQLSTALDENLHVCDACSCPLKLKVHCPIGIIDKYMTPDTRKELDPGCWILSEGRQI